MSAVTFASAGYVCPQTSGDVTLEVKAQLRGQIVPNPKPKGFLRIGCDLDILSFAIVGGGIHEVGESVVSPAFTATYDPAPSNADLNDNDLAVSKDVSSSPTSFSSDCTFQKNGVNESVIFTLSANADGGGSDTAQATAVWQPLVFVGVSSNAGPLTEAQVEALAGNLQPSTAFSGQLSPSSEYIYYAFPTSFGPKTPSNFEIGNFGVGDVSQVQASLNITNANGITIAYEIWRSDNVLNSINLDFTVT